jgi:hypothetical protein
LWLDRLSVTTVSPGLIAGMYCFCAYGRSERNSTPSANVRFLALPAPFAEPIRGGSEGSI